MQKRLGSSTVKLDSHIGFAGCASIAGPMESQGPKGKYFDMALDDDLWGEKTWEKAETKIYYEAVRMAVERSGAGVSEINFILGGDLLNQLIATSFAVRQMDIPFIGLYGACSTMAESLCVGSMLIDGGFAKYVACCASSHFSTAERQFRVPLEQGSQRTPTAQRTVTGAGASVITANGPAPFITHVTIGRVIDWGIKDANNMGAAMAPAAADTIARHLEDTSTGPDYYDAIMTGDLGILGLAVLGDLLEQRGIKARKVLRDCGAEMFEHKQDAHMGGSGCACSGITLNGEIIPAMRKGELKRVLFLSTGALLSTVSSMQGESVPGVAHAIRLEREESIT